MLFPPDLFRVFILDFCDFHIVCALKLLDRYCFDLVHTMWRFDRDLLLSRFIKRFPIEIGHRIWKPIDTRDAYKLEIGRGVVMCKPTRIGLSVFKCRFCKKWLATREKWTPFHCTLSTTKIRVPEPVVRVNHIQKRSFIQLQTDEERLLYYLKLRHAHKRCKHSKVLRSATSVFGIE